MFLFFLKAKGTQRWPGGPMEKPGSPRQPWVAASPFPYPSKLLLWQDLHCFFRHCILRGIPDNAKSQNDLPYIALGGAADDELK